MDSTDDDWEAGRLPESQDAEAPSRDVTPREQTASTPERGRVSAPYLLDERLAASTDLRELVVLTQLRGELIRQEEARADGEHRRYLERLQLYYKLAAAPIAFGTGIVFVAFTPLVGVGLFLLGAGLAAFVPDYVSMILRHKGEREGEQ